MRVLSIFIISAAPRASESFPLGSCGAANSAIKARTSPDAYYAATEEVGPDVPVDGASRAGGTRNRPGPSAFTAREARIVAPASAALSAVPLVRATAAVAAEGVAGTGSFVSSRREYFPGSLVNSRIAPLVLAKLKRRGYTLDGTLFGVSLCSDELNATPSSLCSLLRRGLTGSSGGLFNLGGLGGLPFVGKSGFGAFFSHCPVDGKVVILFGPHVGISQSGVVGKVERVGMTKPSTACGAAIGAFKAILAEGGINPNAAPAPAPGDGSMDNQEEYILEQLRTKLVSDELAGGVGTGFKGNGRMALVTYKTYDLVWELLKKGLEISVTKAEFWEKITEVTLLGGIVINQGDFKGSQKAMMEDYFQPFCFQSWRLQDEDNYVLKEDLLLDTLGMKNPKKILGL